MSLQLTNLNEIPVKTFRWLGINNVSLKDVEVPTITEFKQNFESVDTELYSLDFSSKNFPKVLDFERETYGVSEGVLNQVNKEANSSFYLNIKKSVLEPIIVNYKLDSENPTLVANNFILAEEGSTATVIVNLDSSEDEFNYANSLIKIYAKKNSQVNIVVSQRLNNKSVNLTSSVSIIEEDGKVNYSFIDLGSLNSLSSYYSYLNGENSNSSLDSLYIGEGKKIIDINYSLIQRGKSTLGVINSKGALLDESKKIFRGTLDFKRGASGSIGKEEEYVMLLSPKARNSSIPLLLCREDDVQGEHAASAGKVDEDTLFYLMSRGLSLEESKKLLILAHFTPIINNLPESLREDLVNSIEEKLKNV